MSIIYLVLLFFVVVQHAECNNPQAPSPIPDDVLSAQGTEHQMGMEREGHGGHGSDHAEFLGKERADLYETLTPAQAVQRLRDMFRMLDSDKDSHITEEELTTHLNTLHKSQIIMDVQKNWNAYPAEKMKAGGIALEDYYEEVYTRLAKEAPDGKLPEAYEKLKTRDQRRWKFADVSKDGLLMQEEYSCFMHPQDKERCPHMRDVISLEALEELDLNKNDHIELEEFENFVYKPEQHAGENGKEPEWLEQERQIFKLQRDKNQDGRLDLEEVKAWVVPADYNRPQQEAKHLISMADDNKDNRLSEEEMVAHYDVFVGSNDQQGQHGGEL